MLPVFEHVQREIRNHRLGHPFAGLDRILRPDRRAGGKNLDKREADAIALNFEGAAHRLARLHDVLVVGEGNALHVHRSFQAGNQFGHVQREAFVRGTASPWRRGAALADEGRRGHLAACHAVDRVIHEEHGNLLAAVGGVNNFRGADGSEVAVTLVGNDNLVRTGALDARGAGWGASVRNLHVADVEIVVGEDGAANRADENGLVLEAKILERFGDQLVGDAVSAARAVVRLALEVALAFVLVVEQWRLRVAHFVTRGQDF